MLNAFTQLSNYKKKKKKLLHRDTVNFAETNLLTPQCTTREIHFLKKFDAAEPKFSYLHLMEVPNLNRTFVMSFLGQGKLSAPPGLLPRNL